ncbi:MAG TPA: response regulator [Thermoanaerobaculia bacterium]|nr:response regulator [Thermoanaerobaculia bacterium]
MQTPAHAVLIVEDDEPTRALLSAIVARNGLRPVAARDGKSGLALLQNAIFDAVLLDLLLPELSGVEILADLAEKMPDVLPRVLVVTAALEPEWMARIEVKRAHAVIRKPFDVKHLEKEMMACCLKERPR